MGEIIISITTVFIFMLLIGFFFGFMRDWFKSLIRLGIIIFDFIVALFVSPILTSSFVNKVSNGSKLKIFSYSFDFGEIAKGLLESNAGDDFSLVAEEIEAVGIALINVVVNIVLFIAIFFVLAFLSLIIYWIVILIIKIVHREEKENEENKEKSNSKDTTKDSTQNTKEEKPFWTRFIGGFEGLITSLIICFVVLIPVFGVMNILDKALVENKTNTDIEENVASAFSTNYIAGQLYYTEDEDKENLNKIDNYIDYYANIKKSYNSSFVGKIFNVTGLKKSGSLFFNHLTKVKYKKETVKFSDEAITLIESYNIYKDVFKNNQFKITDNKSLNGVKELSTKISNSKVVNNFVQTVLPVACKNWSNGEKFLGIELKINSDYQDLLNDFINVLSNINSAGRLNYNINILVDTVKDLNNYDVLENINNGNVKDILKKYDENGNENNIIKDSINNLVVSDNIRKQFPNFVVDFINLIYKKTIDESGMELSPREEISIEDWDAEAEKIQNIIYETVDLLNGFESEDAEVEQMNLIGKVLDDSRDSALLSEVIKQFIDGYIKSEKLSNDDFDDEIKDSLITYINQNWDLKDDNSGFKFADIFEIIKELSKFITKIIKKEKVSLVEIRPTLLKIVSDNSLKDGVVDFIETNILEKFAKDDDYKLISIDLFNEVIYKSTEQTLDDEICSIQAIIDLVNIEGNITQETANETLKNIAKSNIIMNYIDEHTNVEGTTKLQKLVSENVTISEKGIIESAIISSELSSKDKIILRRLFIVNINDIV